MPASLTHQESLEQVNQQQLDVAIQLARVLDREANAIKNRDAEALVDLAPEKLEGLTQLETLEQSRLELTSEIAPITAEKTATAQSNGANKLRERVLATIRVCERKNQLNGIMLHLRHEHIQRAMDLITDRDRAAITYAPDGSTHIAAGQFSTSVSA